jgi:hypothetical protein
VHGMVDHVCGSIEKTILATSDNFALGVNENKVGGFDQGECEAEGVYPEVGRLYWILGTVS